jgi:hypothetical protein
MAMAMMTMLAARSFWTGDRRPVPPAWRTACKTPSRRDGGCPLRGANGGKESALTWSGSEANSSNDAKRSFCAGSWAKAVPKISSSDGPGIGVAARVSARGLAPPDAAPCVGGWVPGAEGAILSRPGCCFSSAIGLCVHFRANPLGSVRLLFRERGPEPSFSLSKSRAKDLGQTADWELPVGGGAVLPSTLGLLDPCVRILYDPADFLTTPGFMGRGHRRYRGIESGEAMIAW